MSIEGNDVFYNLLQEQEECLNENMKIIFNIHIIAFLKNFHTRLTIHRLLTTNMSCWFL